MIPTQLSLPDFLCCVLLVYTQSIFRINSGLQPESLLLTKTAGAALAAADPFPPIIGALNSYLHAYHMYRAEALYSF